MPLLPLGAVLGTAIIGTLRNAGEIFGTLPQDSDRGDLNWARLGAAIAGGGFLTPGWPNFTRLEAALRRGGPSRRDYTCKAVALRWNGFEPRGDL